jgi:glycosyltransferase involved in cell wall biosynthesis
VIRQEGQGISAALNTGLRNASGRWLARNDDDDVWLPHLLETLVPYLERDPALGLVYGRCTEIDPEGRPRRGTRGQPLRFPEEPFRSLLCGDPTASITSVQPRSAVVKLGGWAVPVSSHEDWDLALRLARDHDVRFVDSVVARYRRHPDNTTALSRHMLDRHVTSRRAVLERAFAGDADAAAAGDLRNVAWRNLYIGEGNQWLAVGDRRQALRAYRRALAVEGSRVATAGRIAWSLADWFVLPRIPGATDLAGRALRARRRPRKGLA